MTGLDDKVPVPPVPAANARQRRMGILARADSAMLQVLVAGTGFDTSCELLRGPETGLVTVRGRMGGGGGAFNAGEATLTRATVRLADGTLGHAVMLGRDKAKARLAAIIDAMGENPVFASLIEAQILSPLELAAAAADRKRLEETAATRVDFFTLVRGED